MPKLKSHSGAKKRFSFTERENSPTARREGTPAHLQEPFETQKARKTGYVDDTQMEYMRKLLRTAEEQYRLTVNFHERGDVRCPASKVVALAIEKERNCFPSPRVTGSEKECLQKGQGGLPPFPFQGLCRPEEKKGDFPAAVDHPYQRRFPGTGTSYSVLMNG